MEDTFNLVQINESFHQSFINSLKARQNLRHDFGASGKRVGVGRELRLWVSLEGQLSQNDECDDDGLHKSLPSPPTFSPKSNWNKLQIEWKEIVR